MSNSAHSVNKYYMLKIDFIKFRYCSIYAYTVYNKVIEQSLFLKLLLDLSFKTRFSTFRTPDRDIEIYSKEAISMSTGPNLVTICALIKFI